MANPSYLLRGARLADFDHWSRTAAITLTHPEVEFLDENRALRNAERAEETRTNRRLRRLLTSVAAFAVVALAAGGLAWFQADRAGEEARQARAAEASSETRRIAAEAPLLA